MFTNKCIKCGCEFETKNPKRVICPNCLYADKKNSYASSTDSGQNEHKSSYSAGQERPNSYNAGNYRSPYSRNTNNYKKRSYNPNYQQKRENGYQNADQQKRFKSNFNKKPFNRNSQQRFKKPVSRDASKKLLIDKEQLEQIEVLYKPMLPLPNQNAHEIIAEKLGLEPRKVFFGINLIRQKMMLPKLAFPKRKLAVTEDQVFAIKSLYEPLLPLPPIGCHKIIAAQLKMDEWRVHVGIGVVRRQMGLERWNETREDLPEKMKQELQKAKLKQEEQKQENIQNKET